jgi:hypothetical protein
MGRTWQLASRRSPGVVASSGAVSLWERDWRCLLKPRWLTRRSSARRCLAGSPSIHCAASPRRGLRVAGTGVEDHFPQPPGLGPVAAATRPGRRGCAGSGGHRALVDATKLVGTLEGTIGATHPVQTVEGPFLHQRCRCLGHPSLGPRPIVEMAVRREQIRCGFRGFPG